MPPAIASELPDIPFYPLTIKSQKDARQVCILAVPCTFSPSGQRWQRLLAFLFDEGWLLLGMGELAGGSGGDPEREDLLFVRRLGCLRPGADPVQQKLAAKLLEVGVDKMKKRCWAHFGMGWNDFVISTPKAEPSSYALALPPAIPTPSISADVDMAVDGCCFGQSSMGEVDREQLLQFVLSANPALDPAAAGSLPPSPTTPGQPTQPAQLMHWPSAALATATAMAPAAAPAVLDAGAFFSHLEAELAEPMYFADTTPLAHCTPAPPLHDFYSLLGPDFPVMPAPPGFSC